MELVRRQIMERGGYLADDNLAQLIGAGFPLTQVQVRCGGCRFTCAVQDAEQIISAVEEAGDYVRDVSPVPATLNAWRQELNAEIPRRVCAGCGEPVIEDDLLCESCQARDDKRD